MNHDRMFSKILVFVLILISGFGLAIALPWMADTQSKAAYNELDTPTNIEIHSHKNSPIVLSLASDAIDPNPPSPTCFATHDNGATEPFSSTNATAVQQAVDAVSPGNTVKVAGDCAGVQTRAGLTQTVYISKSLTLEGGHTQTNWSLDPDPDTYTTTLDASGEGRVIVVTGTNDVTLDSLTVTAGKVHSKSLEGCGGGIWTNSAFTLTNSRIISNTALRGGGICAWHASPTITSVTFTENSALESGGAMYNDGCNGESSPTLTNVTFSSNSASGNGGAIFNLGASGASSPMLINVSFLGNNAGEHGGAMCNAGFEGESSPVLTNVIFSGNTAGENGGGMYNSGSGITITDPLTILTNNLIGLAQPITSNDLQSSTSSPKLNNVTFSGNSAGDYGGAMFNIGDGGGSHPELNNSILWNNKDSNGTGAISAAIYLTGFATTTMTHSLVEGAGESGVNWIGGEYKDGGSNIDKNPHFIEPISPTDAPTTTGNLRLQSNSPAIDAGDNDLITINFDLDNEPRKKDGNADGVTTVDMGAYEAEGYYQLSVTRTGSGGGQVTSTPAGIDCGSTCNHYFLDDTLVTLAASPDANSTFTGWGGVCSGTENCLIKMTSAMSVAANFETNPQLTVYKAGSGDGTVTSMPKGISCGTDCSQVFPYGTTVKLSAEPDNYSIFKGWSGACIGGGDCSVVMDSHKSVTAIFDKKPDLYKVYLPVSLGLKSSTGKTFSGRVTYQGNPVQVWIDLLKWEGSDWSVFDSKVSGSNGGYEFKNVPKLTGNHKYMIVFDNTYDYDGWLWFWECWDVTSTTIDPSMYRCDFDIENIILYSPDPEAAVPLPQDFLWAPRVTTSDNYVLNIADMNDGDPWTWTDLLGYVYGENMISLPAGFFPYTTYGWWVDVVGPDGWGSSYYYRDVTFLNTTAPSIPNAGTLPNISDLDWSNFQYKEIETVPPRPRRAEGSDNHDGR